MNDKIDITEEDIFLCVKYPDRLSAEKKKYIENNQDLFKEGIELYKSFSANLSEDEISELNENIEKKIFGGPNKTIILTPTWVPQNDTVEGLRLAAASINLEKKTDSVSYADTDSKYLVRVVEVEGKKLLYLLIADKIIPPCRIKLLPSGTEHIIYNSIEPIDVSDEKIIDCVMVL